MHRQLSHKGKRDKGGRKKGRSISSKSNSNIAMDKLPPDHALLLGRLNRAKGQIDGIGKMILERRYCPEIISQLRAAASALNAIEAEVLKGHLRGCVQQAFSKGDTFAAEEKIQEIIKLVY